MRKFAVELAVDLVIELASEELLVDPIVELTLEEELVIVLIIELPLEEELGVDPVVELATEEELFVHLEVGEELAVVTDADESNAYSPYHARQMSCLEAWTPGLKDTPF